MTRGALTVMGCLMLASFAGGCQGRPVGLEATVPPALPAPQAGPARTADVAESDGPARGMERAVGRLASEQVAYSLEWTVRYRNSGSSPARVTLEIPLPPDRPGLQEVESLSLRPRPTRTVTDEWGNRVASVELPEVPAGGSAQAEFAFGVTRTGQAVDVDARAVEPPGPDLDRYLRAEAHILAEDPVIRQAAREVVGDEENPYYRLVRLYDFVRTMDFRLEGSAKGDREVLRSRVAQCADAAGLLVSLARASGIPARYVAGVYFRPEEPITRTTHAWVEAWVAPFGWLSVDPTMGRFLDTRTSRLAQLDAPYLALWEGRGSQGFSARGAAAGEAEVVFHTRVHDRRHPDAPRVPVPRLSGNPEGARSLMPTGAAGAVLEQALQTPPGEARRRLAQEAVDLAPESPAVWKVLVASTSDREALERKLARGKASPARAYARGLLALEDGRYSEAERLLDVAGEGFPVHQARADLYLRTHQVSRAAEALDRASRVHVTRNLVDMGLALYQGLEDPAGTEALCRQAMRIFPADDDLRLAAAEAAFRLGRQEEAAAELTRLRRSAPEDGRFACVLGSLYLEAGDPQQAIPLLREGLEGQLDERTRTWFQGLLASARTRP